MTEAKRRASLDGNVLVIQRPMLWREFKSRVSALYTLDVAHMVIELLLVPFDQNLMIKN
jgi:hypothetical protein